MQTATCVRLRMVVFFWLAPSSGLPTGGKVVAQLKKHVNDNVRAKAQQVREAWSGLLPREPPPAPASNGVNGKPQVPSDGARCGIWRVQKGRVGWTCSCLGQHKS